MAFAVFVQYLNITELAFYFQVLLEREMISKFLSRRWSPSPTNCLWGSRQLGKGTMPCLSAPLTFIWLCFLLSDIHDIFFLSLNVPLGSWHFFLKFTTGKWHICVSGSAKCSQWMGPPSLASWYGSVRAPVEWGPDLAVICSQVTAMAASKCGTWPLRWTPPIKEKRGRKRVRKERD